MGTAKPAPAARAGWQEELERIIVRVVAFVVVVQTVTTGSTMARVGITGVLDAPLLVLLLATQVALIVLCVAGTRRGATRPAVVWPMAIATAGAVVGALLGTQEQLGPVATLMLPTNALQAVQLAAIAFLTRPWLAVGVVLLTGPAHFLVHALAGADLGLPTFEEWFAASTTSFAVIGLVTWLRRGASQAEEMAQRARDERSEAASREAAVAAVDEARRVLHDDVISTLRAVEHGLAPQRIAPLASAAIAALDARNSPGSDLVEQLELASPVPLEVERGEWPVEPPPHVLEALRRAAGEAIRNAARHAQAGRVGVRMGATAQGQVQLEVWDDGVGFDPDALSALGFGLAESVRGRLEQVGGRAEIDAAPGRGTRVRLLWPAPTEEDVADRSTPLRGQHRLYAYLFTMTAPIIFNVYMAIRYGEPELVANVALVVLISALILLAAFRLAAGAPTGRELLAIGVVDVALLAIGLAIGPDGALLSFESWPVGHCANLAALFAFESRIRWVVGLLAALLGTILVFAWQDPTIGTLEPVGALMTPVVVAGLATMAGLLLRRGNRALALQEALLAARQDALTSRLDFLRERADHLAHLIEDVVPFLGRVVAGATDDEESRIEAAVLGLRCRDELAFGEPLPEPARTLVDQARARGVVVSVRVSSDVRHQLQEVGRLLEATLRYATSVQAVTLVPGQARGPWRMTLLPSPSGPELTALAAALADVDLDPSEVAMTLTVWPTQPAADHEMENA